MKKKNVQALLTAHPAICQKKKEKQLCTFFSKRGRLRVTWVLTFSKGAAAQPV
jgi:hypothetical protein